MCMCVSHVWICGCECKFSGKPEVADPLELGLQGVVRPLTWG